MTVEVRAESVRRFLEAFNRGEIERFDELIAPEFFGYVPRPGEERPAQIYSQIGRDLRAAFPDLEVTIQHVEIEEERLTGEMTVSGTHTGLLWGLPPTGQEITFSARVLVRFVDGKLAIAWEDANLIGLLREIGLAAKREDLHKKHEHPIRLPDILLRLAYNRMRLQEKECSHLDQIKVTETHIDVCPSCVESGDEWPALRMCLTCGHVGCCDMSVNKHARKHWRETGHPLIRSIYMDESWIWCYEDKAFLLGHWET